MEINYLNKQKIKTGRFGQIENPLFQNAKILAHDCSNKTNIFKIRILTVEGKILNMLIPIFIPPVPFGSGLRFNIKEEPFISHFCLIDPNHLPEDQRYVHSAVILLSYSDHLTSSEINNHLSNLACYILYIKLTNGGEIALLANSLQILP